jgi:nitronate monooxygenase
LVLLGAGAGGQTGSANPLAFVRAVRERYDGLLVLAGGISDGASILAAQVLGADLAYLGTRFIATDESLAGDDYRSALAAATMDDVRLTSEVGGLPANVLAEWLESRTRETPTAPTRFDHTRVTQLPNVWGAGHGVTSVIGVTSVRELVAAVTAQYQQARHRLRG